jgi:hypothetical protein
MVPVGIKRPRHETDHSPPSSAEAKECVELYVHYPNTPSWRGAQLQHKDNFTFTFTFMDLMEIMWEGFDWIHLAQVRDQWQVLVNSVMKLRVPQKEGLS